MTDFVRCPKCGKQHATTVDTCDCGESISFAQSESRPDIPQATPPGARTFHLDAAQLERIIAAQRLTVLDGVKVGCGIYIMLPLLIALCMLVLAIATGGSFLR